MRRPQTATLKFYYRSAQQAHTHALAARPLPCYPTQSPHTHLPRTIRAAGACRDPSTYLPTINMQETTSNPAQRGRLMARSHRRPVCPSWRLHPRGRRCGRGPCRRRPRGRALGPPPRPRPARRRIPAAGGEAGQGGGRWGRGHAGTARSAPGVGVRVGAGGRERFPGRAYAQKLHSCVALLQPPYNPPTHPLCR